MDCNPLGSSVHGISQARIQESGLPFHSPVEASWPRDWTCNFSIGRQILYHWAMRETLKQMISSVQFSRSVVSDSLQPQGLQHTRLPCPSPTPRACSSSCPLSQWCHPTISSSLTCFSSCLPSFPASESFPRSRLFASGGQSIGVSASASVLPGNIQDWQQEGSHLQTKKQAFTRRWSCRHLDLGFPSLQNYEKGMFVISTTHSMVFVVS